MTTFVSHNSWRQQATATFVSHDPWRQQQTEAMADALQELISGDGAPLAKEGICDAIMTWVNYHQRELDKWKELAVSLNIPVV